MKILIIGGGNMGLTFAKSFLHSHIVTHDKMLILEKSLKKAEELKKLNIGTVYGEPGDYIKEADLLIFAVKPQDTTALFASIKPFVDHQQVALSIMAGVKIETISTALGINKIIRAMPNLPAQVGVGMTAFTSSEAVTRIELVMVQNLLNATGKTIYVETEKAIDAATAISGSGPAYVFYIMQAMIDSGKKMGFSLSESELLTYQTFRGAVELYNKFDLSCDEWIKKVSSRGGTTEAAFNTFHNDALHLKFQDGLKAALRRAEELSKGD
ncbi:pyrroline-5-carboxylate reductase [Portibacter marinus]|uniref:pyrroline-5-carboxylate reductase n=1 Tax=Portibacter marinus TaxID=2898660 RepID=UPI001F42CBF9|nr:pyrroline-5-carboxylate reductase [Portibacter marinus]